MNLLPLHCDDKQQHCCWPEFIERIVAETQNSVNRKNINSLTMLDYRLNVDDNWTLDLRDFCQFG